MFNMSHYPPQKRPEAPLEAIDLTNDIETIRQSPLVYTDNLQSAPTWYPWNDRPKTWLVSQVQSIPRMELRYTWAPVISFKIGDSSRPYLGDRAFLDLEQKGFSTVHGSLIQLARFFGERYDGPCNFTLAIPHNTRHGDASIYFDQSSITSRSIHIMRTFTPEERAFNTYGLLAFLSRGRRTLLPYRQVERLLMKDRP